MEQPQPSHILREEVISSDKDGTLTKIYEKPYDRAVQTEDGTWKTERVEPWEVKATGRKIQELRGIFKDSAIENLQEQSELNRKIGMERVTLPNGTVDEIRADRVDTLREVRGVCRTRIRPGITMPQMPWHKPCGHSRYQNCHCEGERVDG